MYWKPSKRQEEVLFCLSDGMEQKEIAEELGISVETVKWHKYGLRMALGARNSAHAVAIAFNEGLLIPRIKESAYELRNQL